ncbi:hypothetical protein G6F40_017293 [Rhizopus arrhizus]|nr:hypothetical protein G6F40_017293 [Rhizopus arrhizus]
MNAHSLHIPFYCKERRLLAFCLFLPGARAGLGADVDPSLAAGLGLRKKVVGLGEGRAVPGVNDAIGHGSHAPKILSVP